MGAASCKGACAALRVAAGGIGYTTGLKRCSQCSVYMRVEQAHCPCCGTKLRVRATRRPRAPMRQQGTAAV